MINGKIHSLCLAVISFMNPIIYSGTGISYLNTLSYCFQYSKEWDMVKPRMIPLPDGNIQTTHIISIRTITGKNLKTRVENIKKNR